MRDLIRLVEQPNSEKSDMIFWVLHYYMESIRNVDSLKSKFPQLDDDTLSDAIHQYCSVTGGYTIERYRKINDIFVSQFKIFG